MSEMLWGATCQKYYGVQHVRNAMDSFAIESQEMDLL